MNFLSPLAFVFALLLPAVILLYLLKMKRIDTPISSTLLWRKSLEDLKANTPFQKLKRNLLMFLQLAILIVLILAAARPVLRLGGLRSQSFIVLLDRSASMSATDVKPSRLENAKRKAMELVNDMGLGDRMMVIAFDAGAKVLSTFESDPGTLRGVIRSIQPTENPTRISEALTIARSAAEVQPNPELVIFSDGQFSLPADYPFSAMKTHYVPIGESGENMGIVDLSIRRDFSAQQNYQVLVGVQNSGVQEHTAYIELWGEGSASSQISSPTFTATPPPAQASARRLLDARQITLAPGARDALLFSDSGIFPEILEAVLDSDDPLMVDNHAWALIPKETVIKILLVTKSNLPLQRVLNLDPRVSLSVVAPADYLGQGNFDLVVFDAYTPPALAGGRYVFIQTVPPLPGWTMGDTVKFPAIIDWDRFHPLTRYLTLENVSINQCKNLGVPAWTEVIAESRETPLIVAFRQEAIQALVVGFDLLESDWPLRVSFPIFFTNLLDWFTQETGPGSFLKHTGDIISLPPPIPFAEKAELIGPPNQRHWTIRFSEPSPVYFGEADHIGIYEYTAGEAMSKKYAFNLQSAEESVILPNPDLQTDEGQIVGDSLSIESNREIWRILVWLAFLILLFEWWIYVRKARYAV